MFGDMLPRVEDEGIVFLRKDSDHEHASMALHPDGGLTFGYQVDAGPVAVDGLPQDLEDTEQIITRHEAEQTPAVQSPEPEAPPVVVAAPKPPEKTGPERMSRAFPDARPMLQQVQVEPTLAAPQPVKPREVAAQQEQDSQATEAGEAERQRVKLVGRLGRTPTVRETAGGKLVGKFPLAVHLDDGTTKWHNIVAFGERAAAIKTRTEAGELVKGNEIEVVGYLHEREYQGRDGTTKTAQEIYSVAVTRH
ncbi:single-stranded DNA-binding protein [Streptomyces sp. NBC_00366]|uniref:single-stranded DNA-binding protein n=1 Tax=Streptomyces sp. NBC_00366 TaxID=2975727 RepID=UPI002E269215